MLWHCVKVPRGGYSILVDWIIIGSVSGEVTNQQALLLLRCLGTVLAEEHPARRTQLANDVWGTLQELGKLST